MGEDSDDSSKILGIKRNHAYEDKEQERNTDSQEDILYKAQDNISEKPKDRVLGPIMKYIKSTVQMRMF